MNIVKIKAHPSEMVIIKHYLDESRIAFDAFRVGWSEGTAIPMHRRKPIAIRLGRSGPDGTYYLGDYNPDRYIPVGYDEDFKVVNGMNMPVEPAARDNEE